MGNRDILKVFTVLMVEFSELQIKMLYCFYSLQHVTTPEVRRVQNVIFYQFYLYTSNTE
jgi:hypothetical protein